MKGCDKKMTAERKPEEDTLENESETARKPFVMPSKEELKKIRIEDWLTRVDSSGIGIVIIGGVRLPKKDG